MDYRLIACDLDFTLLGVDHVSISERNLSAIRRAIAQGMQFVPTTGRNICMLPDTLFALPFSYLIAGNGAICHRYPSGEKIFEYPIKPDSVKRILHCLRRYKNLVIEVFGEDYVIIDGSFDWNDVLDGHMTTIKPKDLITLPSWDTFDYTRPVYKVNVPMRLPQEILDALYPVLSEDPAIHVVKSDMRHMEITAANATKGAALERLSGDLGIPMASVIAFGDAGNDIEMIRASGCGVAVGSGDIALKEAADYVTAPYDQDGVAVFLETLLKA